MRSRSERPKRNTEEGRCRAKIIPGTDSRESLEVLPAANLQYVYITYVEFVPADAMRYDAAPCDSVAGSSGSGVPVVGRSIKDEEGVL